MGKRLTVDKSFIKRKSSEDSNGCWIWQASLQTHGYSRIDHVDAKRFKTTLGHRISYFLFQGPIEEGMTLDHLCNVKSCVNPDHLEPVTQQENNRRRDQLLGKDLKNFPCGHSRTGPHVFKKRAGVRKNGNIIYQDFCRPCYLAYQQKYNERRRHASTDGLH